MNIDEKSTKNPLDIASEILNTKDTLYWTKILHETYILRIPRHICGIYCDFFCEQSL